MSARFVCSRLPSSSLQSSSSFPNAQGVASSRGEFLNVTAFDRCKDQKPRAWRSIQIICQHSGPETTSLFAEEATETWLQGFPQNQSLPPTLPKRKKRPYVNPKKKLSKKEKKHLEQLSPSAPKNGMLVEELVPVAHNVMTARSILYDGVEKLMKVLPVHACDFCLQIHVGRHGHHIRSCQGRNSNLRNAHHLWVKANIDDILVPVESFHLLDRLAKRIKHEQRFKIDRLPAVVELCIQAGVDLPEYPTLRRTRPIKSVSKDEEIERDEDCSDGISQLIAGNVGTQLASKEDKRTHGSCEFNDNLWQDAEKEEPFGTIDKSVAVVDVKEDIRDIAKRTLQAWSAMRKGVQTLMKRYPVKACGYCPEVHVGPCGHGARVCGEFKHQWRDGQHGWQEAALDDIIPPKFVWHVRDKDGPPMANGLRKFYGQAPAVVELCVQGGAKVPDLWRPMMRLDVVIPALEEVEAVA